jgi:hypothetical protein
MRIDEILRAEDRRILATLIRLLGDFDVAEEALPEAFAAALEQRRLGRNAEAAQSYRRALSLVRNGARATPSGEAATRDPAVGNGRRWRAVASVRRQRVRRPTSDGRFIGVLAPAPPGSSDSSNDRHYPQACDHESKIAADGARHGNPSRHSYRSQSESEGNVNAPIRGSRRPPQRASGRLCSTGRSEGLAMTAVCVVVRLPIQRCASRPVGRHVLLNHLIGPQ